MSYPGGKNGSGVYQAIINQMPPHDLYVEPFLGFGAIMRRKRPAVHSIGIELDAAVAADRRADLARHDRAVVEGCGMAWLQRYPRWTGRELVYCDPPYVISSRRVQAPLYRHELGELDHAFLLGVLRALPCMVMISGYASPLYARELADWRLVTFMAATRGRPALEHLWCNFPAPKALHDYSFLGDGWRARQRIARKARRWRAKYLALDPLERQAVLGACLAADGD